MDISKSNYLNAIPFRLHLEALFMNDSLTQTNISIETSNQNPK